MKNSKFEIPNSKQFGAWCLIFGALLVTCYLLPAPSAFAADASSSATPSSSLKAEVLAASSSGDTIKSKIKQLQEEIASKAAKLKSEITSKLQNKAYIGVIKEINSSSLSLNNGEKVLTVKLTQFTQYSGKKVTSSSSLTAGDYVAALGDVDDNENLTAKKVIKLPAKLSIVKGYMGTITEVTDKSITLKTPDNQSMSINLTNTTSYLTSTGPGTQAAIRISQQVAIITQVTDTNTYEARMIYVLPPTFTGSNAALPIGSSSASKSTPTPTPTPSKLTPTPAKKS